MADDMGAVTVIVKRGGPGRWWQRSIDTVVIYPSDSVTITNHRGGGKRRPRPVGPRPLGPSDVSIRYGGIANETVDP